MNLTEMLLISIHQSVFLEVIFILLVLVELAEVVLNL